MLLKNWGNYPAVDSQVFSPDNKAEIQDFVKNETRLIARGNGKCYGDAALAPKVLSTLNLNSILDFDSETGIIHCEAGVLLREILDRVVPAGWFFYVTPGIKNITVGGAVASDVHGKNHPTHNCFSHYLESIELMRGDGEIVWCSKTEHADLFWQTCGGMGWTGVILSARFRLRPIQSINMQQKAVRGSNLTELFEAFESHAHMEYAAAWVDCLQTGQNTGRGVAYFADHVQEPDAEPLRYPNPKTSNIPMYAPSWVLNRWSIALHNQMLFTKDKSSDKQVSIDQYFYPLDKIRNWNRLYGRRGFIQYQFCIPEAEAEAGILEVLKCIQSGSNRPFLSVLKRHGERPKEAINSFPIKGYSLALDFPRTRTVKNLIAALDQLIWDRGGKVYLTKDACSEPRMGRVDPRSFGEEKFHSLLKSRLLS